MHSIQWYLKCSWNHVTHGLRHPIFVTKDLVQALQSWSVREHLSQEMHFTLPSTTVTLTMDASMEGWGSHCRLPGSTMALYSALWSRPECQLHINVLELQAVCTTLLQLEQEIFSQTVLIESDNMATVSYINKQGGVVSKTLNDEICALYE